MLDLCEIFDGEMDLQLQDLDEDVFESNIPNSPMI